LILKIDTDQFLIAIILAQIYKLFLFPISNQVVFP